MSIDFTGRLCGSLNLDLSKYLTKNGADINYINEDGDKMTGDLDMNNHTLTNVRDPVKDGDVINLKYFQEGVQEVGQQVTTILTNYINSSQNKVSSTIKREVLNTIINIEKRIEVNTKAFTDIRDSISVLQSKHLSKNSFEQTKVLRTVNGTIPVKMNNVKNGIVINESFQMFDGNWKNFPGTFHIDKNNYIVCDKLRVKGSTGNFKVTIIN